MKNYSTYTDKYNEFSRTLLRAIIEKEEKKNVVISPLSIIALLCLTARATAGNTREEILSCISDGSSIDEMISIIREITEKAEATSELKNANAVGVAERIKESLNPEFVRILEEEFNGELFASVNLEEDINNWVNEHTNGMIDKLIDSPINELIACILNAVAFNADWEKEYYEDDIYDDDFTNADGTVAEVEMLSSEEERYIEDASYTGFLKPYKGHAYSFMALLPKHKTNRFMLHDLKTVDFTKLFNDSIEVSVNVSMPEFKYTYGGDISDICTSLGMKQAFTPAADFSPMTTEWAKIDSIIHKAHIELDRKGTKAAAVTASMVVCGCAILFEDETKNVTLDRPFVYAIMHNETGLPIFTGVVNQL